MNPQDAAAHSPNGDDWSEAHALIDHLQAVSTLAGQRSVASDLVELAKVAGLWHDLGKYRPAFQRYIRGERGLEKSHKLAGAALALRTGTRIGKIVAFAIAGHHGGLPRDEGPTPSLSGLKEYGENELAEAKAAGAPAALLTQMAPSFPESLVQRLRTLAPADVSIAEELITRFLFSALVDADYQDTAAFYDPLAATERHRATAAQAHIPELRKRLDDHLDRLMAGVADTPVNRQRADIVAACRAEAEHEPGIFDLTVPTGGGKTLAALAFALRHAERHGLRRVVVVLPFTAIIEQNAAVYASILGPENILEHHGAFDAEAERIKACCRSAGIDSESFAHRHKLLSENWDAPIVVTTSVQFLESLHAHKPERCRKLHNLAQSVVILDEAQAIPVGLFDATCATLRVLCPLFQITLVCCTATQPALHRRIDAEGKERPGLGTPRAIIANPGPLFAALDRITVEWPSDITVATTWDALAERVRAEHQALVVVHRRQDAYELSRLIGEDTIHLSTLMLPAHRARILTEVRERLQSGLSCRVVSTQLIEAGVDVDFPVVFRALAGVDSLAQAAGRCNREGRLGPQGGRFIVFVAPSPVPRGILSTAARTTTTILRAGPVDLRDPDLYRRFYARLYDSLDTDAKQLAEYRKLRDFPEIADRYCVIDDQGSVAVAVPWAGLDTRTRRDLTSLAAGYADTASFRRIRRAMVPIPKQVASRWLSERILVMAPKHPIPLLDLTSWPDRYDVRFGLCIWDDPALSPDQLII